MKIVDEIKLTLPTQDAIKACDYSSETLFDEDGVILVRNVTPEFFEDVYKLLKKFNGSDVDVCLAIVQRNKEAL